MSKVLIVDDMEIARVQISRACSQIGIKEILMAPHAMKALEILDSDPSVDAVISDYNMPQLTGGDLLKEIRKNERYKSIPFIFITSEGEKTQMESLKSMGITGYITKPFSIDSLKQDLTTYLKSIVELGQ